MAFTTHVDRRIAAWGKVLTPRDHDLSEKMADELAKERKQLTKMWGEHPWKFLIARDPTTTTVELGAATLYFPEGRPLIFTTDERDDNIPVKAFPNKPHLAEFSNLLISSAPERRIILVDKSRQMMATTICALVMMWFCMFFDARRCLLSRTKEDDAIEVGKDKIRTPHSRMPDWVRNWNPLPDKPAAVLPFTKTRSYIRCVTQNVAESEGRGGTPSVMLLDEAARQFMFKQIMAAVLPAAGRVWAITTPEAGTPGAMAFYSYFEERADVNLGGDAK